MFRTIATKNSYITRSCFRKLLKNNTQNFGVQTFRKLSIYRDFKNFKKLKYARFPQQLTLIRQYADLPAHSKVLLPALSPTMETGTIVSWAKKEGDKLNEGDLLAEIETDKATMGFETPEEGYLAKIIAPSGTKNIPVGKLVCIIVQEEGDIAAFNNYTDDSSSSAPSGGSKAVADPPASSPPAASGKVRPPHVQVALPALSPTMETGTLVSWAKKEGEKLNEGDLLAEIETDKATMGFETPEEGYLAKILVKSGEKNIKVGQLVCIIVQDEADIAEFSDFTAAEANNAPKPKATSPPPETPSATVSTPAAQPPVPVSISPPSAGGRVGPMAIRLNELRESRLNENSSAIQDIGGRAYASPMAKRIAEQRQIRLQGKGSGIFDSITTKDLDKLGSMPASAAPSAPGPSFAPGRPQEIRPSSFKDLPVSNIRAVIAKRLLQSKTTIPHYYLSVDVNLDKLTQFRTRINKELEKQKIKLSVNDFIIKAVAMACKRNPEVNAAWMDSFIRQYDSVDVSVAVSTDKGLITPIVFNADAKGLIDISQTVKDLARKARENKLQPQEFQGGTISISNLGMFGINSFSAIINPPQGAILAVGTSTMRLIPCKEKGYRSSEFITATLSCDHRVIDGAVGALWLKSFRECLEDPFYMIL